MDRRVLKPQKQHVSPEKFQFYCLLVLFGKNACIKEKSVPH